MTTSYGPRRSAIVKVPAADSANWDTAYGWGNHANANYATESLDATIADHAVSGLRVTRRADVALALFDACYVKSDGDIAKAQADAAGTVPSLMLATAAIDAETNGVFLLLGLARDDSWSWTPGGALYVDPTTAGALTQTRPSGDGEQVQIVGYAISATIIFWRPDMTVVEVET